MMNINYYRKIISIFILFAYLNVCRSAQIPDQQIFIDKLYYYKLALSEQELTKINEIHINEANYENEITKNDLTKWFLIWRTNNDCYLLALPTSKQKGMHFLHLQILNNDKTRVDDVFVIDVIEAPMGGEQRDNCVLQLQNEFKNLTSIWSVLFNLMPSNLKMKLNHENFNEHKFSSRHTGSGQVGAGYYSGGNSNFNTGIDMRTSTNVQSEDSKINFLIYQWSASLFTVKTLTTNDHDGENNSFNTNSNDNKYRLQVNNQPCNLNMIKNGSIAGGGDFDDIRVKLQKLGLQYSVLRLVQLDENFASSMNYGEDYNDDGDDRRQSSRTNNRQSGNEDVDRQTKDDYDDVNNYSTNDDDDELLFNFHRKRHAHDAHKINPTPVLLPDWMTVSTISLYSNQPVPGEEFLSNFNNLESVHPPLQRVIPVFNSPAIAVTTVQQQPAEVMTTDSTVSIKQKNFYPDIYKTPVIYPEPPTDSYDELLTPTPVLSIYERSTYFDISASDSVIIITDEQIISSQPELDLFSSIPYELSSTSLDFEISSSSISSMLVTPSLPESKPPLPRPPYGQTGPSIHKRIPKLLLIAGRFWKYQIPAETFYDMEDGDTRSLKLSFFMFDLKTNRQISPPIDYWIQFDYENQYLFALPTEKNSGKHKFTLVAMDSNGALVEETLEVHVRQHASSRAFNHIFTLYGVTWDFYKYPLIIEGAAKLARRVARVYGDQSLNAFTIQSIDMDTSGEYSISWTNSSLPAYPCPRTTIDHLFMKIADLSRANGKTKASPSHYLSKLTTPEFKIASIGLRYLSSCGGSTPIDGASTKSDPSLRNPIDRLSFKYGEVIRYQIRKDMFYAPRGGTTRDLELSLLTIDGHILPRDGVIGFDAKQQEIYGLALEHTRDIELLLVARDAESGGDSSDAFIVAFEDDRRLHTFEMSISLAYTNDGELDLETKVQLCWRIATILLADSDPSSLKVLGIKKYLYNPYMSEYRLNEKNLTANQPQEQLLQPELKKDDLNLNLGVNALHHNYLSNELSNYQQQKEHHYSIGQTLMNSAAQYYYEFIWTNVSNVLINGDGEDCPTEKIHSNIIQPVFSYSLANLEALKEKFEPDFNLLHIGFKPVGKCLRRLSERELGIKPLIIYPRTTTESVIPDIYAPTGTVPDIPNQVGERHDDDYYMSTILPAIIIVSIILIFSCVVAVMAIRYRRKQEKARFEVAGVMRASNGFLADRDIFHQKGRVPVILESELQQQQPQQFINQQRHIAPVILPSQDLYKNQPMIPMRPTLNKTYQPFPQSQQQSLYQPQQQHYIHPQQQQQQRVLPPPYFGGH